MRERFQLPVPMWRVQYQLLGGHRRTLGIAFICTSVLVAGSIGLRDWAPADDLDEVTVWLVNGLAAIQAIAVILGGCNAVYRAMLRDYDTKMIESHRLTPMSDMTVALGYLFGSTLQIQVVFLVILAFGSVLTTLAGYRVVDWIYGNVFLLNGAVTLWSIVVLSGLRPAKPVNPAPIMIGVAVLGMGVWILPAAGLLLCAYPVVIGFQIITGASTMAPVAVGLLGGINLIMTAFWLSAAAAKYRRPDLPALNAFRGLLLLALWVVLGTAGIVLYASGRIGGLPVPQSSNLILGQWIATMALALVVAIPAIAGAVECRILGERGATLRGWPDRIPPVVTALIAVTLICVAMGAIGGSVWQGIDSNHEPWMKWVYSGSACLLAMLTAWAVLLTAYTMQRPRKNLGAILLLVLWGAPLLIDLARLLIVMEQGYPSAFTTLLGFSPGGTIVAVWAPVGILLWPGLLSQAAMAVALTWGAWHVTKLGRARVDHSLPPVQAVR